MNNLFSKSANRLLEKSSIPLEKILRLIKLALLEQRHQRSDLKDISLKLEKLLIDKHLQMQVDEYFKEDEPVHEQSDLD